MTSTAAKETQQTPDPWHIVYRETMDALITVADRRMAKHVPQFIADMNDVDALSWMESARHESWELLKSGLQHLKEWGPGRGPGSISVAAKKASLRSSAMAVSLNVPMLQMEDPPHKRLLDPMAEALFVSREMANILQQDMKQIAPVMKRAINEDTVMAIFGIDNPALKKLFQSVAGQRDLTPPSAVAPADVKKMERQMKAQLKTLTLAYNEASTMLQKAIFWLPLTPPKFGEKIQAPEL